MDASSDEFPYEAPACYWMPGLGLLMLVVFSKAGVLIVSRRVDGNANSGVRQLLDITNRLSEDGVGTNGVFTEGPQSYVCNVLF